MAQGRCKLMVQGLDCPSEVPPVQSALKGFPGVIDLKVAPTEGRVDVEFDPEVTNPTAIAERITSHSGMKAEVLAGPVIKPPPLAGIDHIQHWLPTIGSGLALILGMILAWTGSPSWSSSTAYALAVVVGGIELFPRAWRGLSRFRFDVHVLMGLAVMGAVLVGEWHEAATVAFLFGLSEALESLTLERARRAVRALLEIAPETAERIEQDGSSATIPASEVQVGDRLRVRAGDHVPVDGRILSGRSSVDQKALTGESVPVLREPGDQVFAGTVNGDGTLEIEATKPLGDSVVSRIVERVRSAQAGRTPVERTIERFATIYTPLVVALALTVMIAPPLVTGSDWHAWFRQGLVVLVIACPCALVIGTPVAVVAALTAASRRGLLIKSGEYLEAFGHLKVLAFDKTGTLTLGRPDVVEVVPTDGRGRDGLLQIAAALGDRGGHILGRAIARHARQLALEVPHARDYQAVPGMGATGQVGTTRYHMGSHRFLDETGLCPPDFHASLGAAEQDAGTSVALSDDREPLGWLRLADRPRPEAAAVLADLNQLGIETVMLTGDNPTTAAAVASELNVNDYRAALLPADKATAVSELDAQRGPTGMVGDGVNDAPALAAARVGVAMGDISSGAAIETADVVLMADDLTGLPWLVRHSRRALRTIRFNIALAVGTKLAFLILAILGLANLWMAIAADVGVSLLVVAIALRLLRSPNQTTLESKGLAPS